MSGTLTGDVDLPLIAGLVYSLDGTVEVGVDAGGDGSGGTVGNLTIDAGVTVYASQPGDGLVVNRGSTINANGTIDDPVIFTARDDILGTATIDDRGLWDGITLIGRAPVSDCDSGSPDNKGGTRADCERPVEGLAGKKFGGNSAEDSSGSLEFVQVFYAGGSANTESYGLRLVGVGDLTTLENIQVFGSGGDGIHIRGGRPSISNFFVSGFADDGLDTDDGFQGALHLGIIWSGSVAYPANHGWEADGDGNLERLPRQQGIVSNLTIVGKSTDTGSGLELGGAGDYGIFNTVVGGFPTCLDIDGFATVRIAEPDLEELGPPVFGSVLLQCADPYEETDGDILGIDQLFDTFTNARDDVTSTLTNSVRNGPNESAIPWIDPFEVYEDLLSDVLFQQITVGFAIFNDMPPDHIGAVPENEDFGNDFGVDTIFHFDDD